MELISSTIFIGRNTFLSKKRYSFPPKKKYRFSNYFLPENKIDLFHFMPKKFIFPLSHFSPQKYLLVPFFINKTEILNNVPVYSKTKIIRTSTKTTDDQNKRKICNVLKTPPNLYVLKKVSYFVRLG